MRCVAVHYVVVVQGVSKFRRERCEEAGLDQRRRGSVNTGFALGCVSGSTRRDMRYVRGRTCPPEKPTAMTPSWSFEGRNFDSIVGGLVIVVVVDSGGWGGGMIVVGGGGMVVVVLVGGTLLGQNPAL